MTNRERFFETLAFGKPDRVFYKFGWPRASTSAAWRLQGLPRLKGKAGFGQRSGYDDLVGADLLERGVPVEAGPIPAFEEKVLEETEHGEIRQESSGIIVHDAGKRLNTPGFRTRIFVSHPVRDRGDWLEMRPRFDPSTEGRYPQDWDQLVKRHRRREFPILQHVPGLYLQVRDWLGFDRLSVMFYDDPDLVHEMMEHVTVFLIELLQRAMSDGMIDAVMFSEDMAYKTACMISPAMFEEFMLPRYRRLVRAIENAGVAVVLVDSDGHIGELIPLWIDAGVDGTWPIEIAAGNDPVAYRKRFGKKVALWGGIDKREIRSREQVYREVMGKVPWLIDQGGYIPKIDHGIPPDVPLRGFLYMCEVIKAIAEERPVPAADEPLPFEASLGPIVRMWTPDMEYDPETDEYRS